MSLLSDRDLHAALDTGQLRIDPLDRTAVQPASIELRLGDTFRWWLPRDGAVDDLVAPADPDCETAVVRDGGGLVMLPGDFVLGHTVETIALGPGYAARLEGRSSLGRRGLATHVTAGWIDPGFTGQITLELVNLSPRALLLTPGMRIGQLAVFAMSSPAERPYGSPGLGSRYQGQAGPTVSAGVPWWP